MKESYKRVVEDVPYNNAAAVLSYCGLDKPEQLGGDCVHQARMLAVKLRKKGYDPKFIYCGNHVAVVCEDEGEMYYMDPFLMHGEPVPLRSLVGGRGVRVYDSFPLIDGGKWMIGVSQLDYSRFGVRLIGVKANGESFFVKRFEFDLLERRSELKGVNGLTENRAFTVHCMRRDGTVSRLKYDIRSQLLRVSRFGGEVFRSDRQTLRVMLEVDELEEELGLFQGSLLEVFHTAAEIRMGLADVMDDVVCLG